MGTDVFAVLAEPTRRRILDELRTEERSVTTLVSALGVSQPTVSKHLRVLRDAGLVSCRVAAQQRIYRVEPQQLQGVDDWLAPYRTLWSTHLDALARHLDAQDADQHDAQDGSAPDGDEAPHRRAATTRSGPGPRSRSRSGSGSARTHPQPRAQE